MYRTKNVILVIWTLAIWPALIWATEPQDKGYELMKQVSDANKGWRTTTADLTMVLSSIDGESLTRRLTMRSLEKLNDGSRTLLIFVAPMDVAGTALLTHSLSDNADMQWLYLPALKRVKRIATRSRSGAFMGSEFSYEDLSTFELEDYRYQFLRSRKYKDIEVSLVEAFPLEDSAYTRLINYVDTSAHRIVKTEFYNRRDQLFKTLEYSDFTHHLDRYWRAHQLLMTNHLNGRSTRLQWSNYLFNVELRESDFRKEALPRLQ